MRKLLTLAIILITLFSCSKDYSHFGNCGKVLQKIHDKREPIGNEIWALVVSATDSTERFVAVDSSTWNKINIGDKYCDK